MALEIVDLQVTSHGKQFGTGLVHFAVSARFQPSGEFVTFTVHVLAQSGEAAMKGQAIARAKELARQFDAQASA